MKQIASIIQYELKHFARSPFKIASIILFAVAGIYGLQNGYDLLKKQASEIAVIKEKNEETISMVTEWYEQGKKGPEDRPWIDITTPLRAVWYAPSSAIKNPSKLLPFNIGQTEQYGYYKQVTNWSSTFDADMAEEITNPEHLITGTLDFSFVILYLLPVLIIVLLFNIGGLEKDLGFDKLIQINNTSLKKWLLARFTFYFIILLVLLAILMLPYAVFTGALQEEFQAFFKLFLFITLYMFIWFVVFYFINLSGKKTADQSIKMVTVWLLICVIIPGAIHQIVALKYPANYMTDFIDANRKETYAIWDLPTDSLHQKLIKLYPELVYTEHGKDTIIDNRIVSNSSSAVVNSLMKKTSHSIENQNEEKNRFIQNTWLINPISYFQNKMNAVTENDYYAYKAYRAQIQNIIDKKVNAVLFDTWNKKTINKEKYLKYITEFNK